MSNNRASVDGAVAVGSAVGNRNLRVRWLGPTYPAREHVGHPVEPQQVGRHRVAHRSLRPSMPLLHHCEKHRSQRAYARVGGVWHPREPHGNGKRERESVCVCVGGMMMLTMPVPIVLEQGVDVALLAAGRKVPDWFDNGRRRRRRWVWWRRARLGRRRYRGVCSDPQVQCTLEAVRRGMAGQSAAAKRRELGRFDVERVELKWGAVRRQFAPRARRPLRRPAALRARVDAASDTSVVSSVSNISQQPVWRGVRTVGT